MGQVGFLKMNGRLHQVVHSLYHILHFQRISVRCLRLAQLQEAITKTA